MVISRQFDRIVMPRLFHAIPLWNPLFFSPLVVARQGIVKRLPSPPRTRLIRHCFFMGGVSEKRSCVSME